MSASLSTAGRVSLDTPADADPSSVSPVCGCATLTDNTWRGITFAGRDLRIERDGQSPHTQWRLYPGSPGPTLLDLNHRRILQADVLRLSVKRRFSPARFVRGDWRGISVVEHEQLLASTVPVVATGSMNVYLDGPVPVSAWIPFPGSKVQIGSTDSPYPQNARPATLTEDYGESLGFDAETFGQAAQRYPLLDVLGPEVLFWTNAPDASIPGVWSRSRRGTILAVVVRRGTFTVRMAAEPMTAAERRLLNRRGKKAYLVDPQSVPKGGPYAITGVEGVYGSGDGGRLRLTVRRGLDQRDYERVRAFTRDHPRQFTEFTRHSEEALSIENKETKRSVEFVGLEHIREEERFPPLPAVHGFNVFGRVSALDFDRVSGELAIDEESVPVRPASRLRFEDVNDLVDPEGRQLLSVPAAESADDVPVRFSANSNVRLNGESKTGFLRRNKGTLNVLLAIFGFLAGVLSVIQFFGRPRARPPRRSASR